MAITWLPWSADAFARARSEGKCVLLSIAPTWCRYSSEMDRTSFADPDVAALVNSRFVPIRVDADRRPDVSGRYNLGAWPTTVFLTPDGDMIGGGTYVERPRLLDVLQRVHEAFISGRHVQPLRRTPTPAPAPLAVPAIDQLVDLVTQGFDPVNGGFGDRPKFPHVAPIRLALALYAETESQQFHDIAVTSLDAMGWGPLYDEQNGGFFRCAQNADWSRPNEEKLLDVNASLLSLYVDAFETLRLTRYGERAEDILRYVQTWLADPVDGGWAGSQRADAAYYTRSAESGTTLAAPPVDRTLFIDWNAAMVSAALQAGRVMGDSSLSEFAIRSLERVVLLGYKPGAGVAHYVDGTVDVALSQSAGSRDRMEVRGLLDDQIAMASAQLDAFEATGNVVYEMMAEELALYAIRTMWDEEAGGFFDRAADVRRDIGLLKDRIKPFVTNCLAATTLHRAARASGSSELADYAERTLVAIGPSAADEGPLAAAYVLAVRAAAER